MEERGVEAIFTGKGSCNGINVATLGHSHSRVYIDVISEKITITITHRLDIDYMYWQHTLTIFMLHHLWELHSLTQLIFTLKAFRYLSNKSPTLRPIKSSFFNFSWVVAFHFIFHFRPLPMITCQESPQTWLQNHSLWVVQWNGFVTMIKVILGMRPWLMIKSARLKDMELN